MNDFQSIFINNFNVLDWIGRGGFGSVCKVEKKIYKNDLTQRITAMKVIKITEKYDDAKANREFEIHQKLQHENILQFFQYWKEQPPNKFTYHYQSNLKKTTDIKYFLFIETEYCDFGSIKNYLEACWRSLSYSRILMYQIAKGLEFLHKNKIIHRDLKPENILLKSEVSRIVAKIGDFGLSRVINSTMTTGPGSNGYRSPEVIESGKYTEQADIFSFGVVYFQMIVLGNVKNTSTGLNAEMLKGDSPFCTLEQLERWKSIVIDDWERSFVLRMLKRNPKDRINVEQIISSMRDSIFSDIVEDSIVIPASNHAEKFTQFVQKGNNDMRLFRGLPDNKRQILKDIELTLLEVDLCLLKNELKEQVETIKLSRVTLKQDTDQEACSRKIPLPKLRKFYFHEERGTKDSLNNLFQDCTDEKVNKIFFFTPNTAILEQIYIGINNHVLLDMNKSTTEENYCILAQSSSVWRHIKVIQEKTISLMSLRLRGIPFSFSENLEFSTAELEILSLSYPDILSLNFTALGTSEFQHLQVIHLSARNFQMLRLTNIIRLTCLKQLRLEWFEISLQDLNEDEELFELDELSFVDCKFHETYNFETFRCDLDFRSKVLNILCKEYYKPSYEIFSIFLHGSRSMNLTGFNWSCLESAADKNHLNIFTELFQKTNYSICLEDFSFQISDDNKWKVEELKECDILRIKNNLKFEEMFVVKNFE